MNLDLTKLENCHKRGKKTIARCPACSESGHDTTGNHLVISEDGRFGCVVYQGEHGSEHRKRIFQLVGEKTRDITAITLKNTSQSSQAKESVFIKNVLGQLGQNF